MNKQAHDALIAARITLLLDHYFFGRLAMHLKLVEEKSVSTLAVDGRHIFYNPDFILGLSPALRISGFVHEIMHCVCEHMLRRNGRDPLLWNLAGDYVINLVLKDSKFLLGDGWLCDEKYRDMTTEHIYSLLEQEFKDKPKPQQFDEVRDSNMTSDEAAEAALEWKGNVQQAATMARQHGKLPAALSRFVEELLPPQVPWQTILQRFVTQTNKNDYAWSRPNRRMVSHGFCLPSLYSENMGILGTGIDTSGSIDDVTLQAFASEITAAFNASSPEKLVNIYCDARVAHVDEVDQGGELPQFKCYGGGSTDFRPPFAWLEEHGIKPAAFIYLTDGYGPFPEQEPDFPVLWCMTTDVVPPWGEHVRIKV